MATKSAAALKVNPLAVRIGPPALMRPVFFRCSGKLSLTPKVERQAMFPVFTSTATRLPQGGCWQGRRVS